MGLNRNTITAAGIEPPGDLPVNTTQQSHERRTIPLTQLTKGQRGRVMGEGNETDEVRMLSAMGLRPDASVTMCRMGEPCIVSLSGACGGGCRIGLARGIAEKVMVEIDS